MADTVHQVGVKALLDHLVDSTFTLQTTTNCMFALLVQGSYTPTKADASMAVITGGSHEWTGTAANGGATTTAPLNITVASISTAIDADGHVRLILPDLQFGNVTLAGSTVLHCTVYVEIATTPADSTRYPLFTLTDTAAKQPVLNQNFTWLMNPNGVGLFNLNP